MIFETFSQELIESGSQAISKLDGIVEDLIQLLHAEYAKEDTILTQPRRSVKLLLSTLAACYSTAENRAMFTTLKLQSYVLETGKQDQTLRKVVLEVLRNFDTGEC